MKGVTDSVLLLFLALGPQRLVKADFLSDASVAFASATSAIIHNPADVLDIYSSLTSRYGPVPVDATGSAASEFAPITSLMGAIATDPADGVPNLISNILSEEVLATSILNETLNANDGRVIFRGVAGVLGAAIAALIAEL
ncbi:hypothetical protein CLCR_10984 [Cladophialophora carrionii]|uniref:Uncharacterized protein n=1 Tax=Cladophialophora carrionii TaxID=86049 RepID=A0A1C1CW11_9EURO|nr:hypothetical protein CLCR_10984 [Cladophialophora carrionii]